MSYELTTLPNGLRVITDHVPDMHSVAVGIWCDVGARYERADENGIAHLVEHMMFKGTPTRTAAQIAEAVEDVGGQMNAYTSREVTAYFIHLLKDDVPLALEILADILQNPIFPEEELDRERQVILQEIGMYHDSPDDHIFDLYQAKAFPGQALGAPILGTADIIQSLPQKSLFSYIRRYYTPGRLVISAAGAVDHADLVKLVESLLSGLPSDEEGIAAAGPTYGGGEVREEKALEQTHIVLGFPAVARTAPDYYSSVLLSTILGGGMSSRLFQEVREKRGLLYSVYSHHDAYRDTGLLEIYAGTGPDRLCDLMPVVCTEVQKLVQESVSPEELARAKAQVKAALLMGRESMLSRANRQAKHLLNFGEAPNIDRTIERIDAVTADAIQILAGQIFSGTPTLAALGPVEGLASFDVITDRLAA